MASLWLETSQRGPLRPAMSGELVTDVLIIGGGMAGLLTAYRLTEAGVNSVVVEAKSVDSGATQNTTAKITAQHGLMYADLIRRFGVEKARLYYNVNMRSVGAYRALSSQCPCDFEDKTAYVYSTESRLKLEREAEAYRQLGLPASLSENLPLPFKTYGALAMKGQAQFHPLKLLYSLLDRLEVYENTLVRRIEGSVAYTDGGNITAKHIVLATHFPLVNIPGLYFVKLYQSRGYVLALEGAPSIDGLYLDERKDGHSFRTYGDFLLMGGGGHKTGKPGGGYDSLRALASRAYPGAVERYHWAAQDCMTLDSVPYVGRHRRGANHLYVATGFNKWGMTGSMTAATLICDLIVHGKSDLEPLFTPRRSLLTGQLFVRLGSAAAGLLSIGGPRCSHMGCKLHWNKTEKSWDCSCHGSRFDEKGHVIDNPAAKGIRP